MQSLCLMSHPVHGVNCQFLSCPCGAAPMAVSVTGEVLPVLPVSVPDPKGAVILPCFSLLCWSGSLHSVNKLFIYFPHSSFNFFFPPASLDLCTEYVLWEYVLFQSPAALEGRSAGVHHLQCSENALGSPHGSWAFGSILQNVSAMVENLFLFLFLISAILTAVRIHCWFCHIYNLRTRNNISKLPHYLPGFCCFALKWQFLLLLLNSLPVLETRLN